ncbi:MAG: DUF805 domain-containing protein [Prevotellaceae bacterium]|jgi:uncharacterized membrane protein YhaH (DUF805 family)|nr:DUF805 domain-containing protein [Prevotellaceae bacterium]
MNWYLKVFKQYADFRGRARRKEYWIFTLFNAIFMVAAVILDKIVGINIAEGYGIFNLLVLLYGLAVFIPVLAVCVRRLHDIGKSGWMLLIGLIPMVGSIILLVWFFSDSQPGNNNWGANPKE